MGRNIHGLKVIIYFYCIPFISNKITTDQSSMLKIEKSNGIAMHCFTAKTEQVPNNFHYTLYGF